MRKILTTIMLSCDEATFLMSIKSFRKLTLKERIQLSMHKAACVYCRRFSKFNDLIDENIYEACSLNQNKTELSAEKKEKIQNTLEKEMKI